MFRINESLEFGLCRNFDFQIDKKIPYKFCKTWVDIIVFCAHMYGAILL
jgi:hypothetical protein